MIEDHFYWLNRPTEDVRRDWGYKAKARWFEDYWRSVNHPHRKLIVNELKRLPYFESVLELGCNCGPNLYRIKREFPRRKLELTGLDINKDAIEYGKIKLPDVDFRLRRIDGPLIFPDKGFDVVITDATLIYIPPEKIHNVMDEICRVTSKMVILVEWFGDTEEGEIKDFHWARDYCSLFKKRGFSCRATKITKEDWPSKSWLTHGCLFVAVRNNEDKTNPFWTYEKIQHQRKKVESFI